MRGLILFIKILVVLTIALPTFTAHGKDGKGTIAVLLSDTEKIYSSPLNSFVSKAKSPVSIHNLQGNIRKDPGLKNRLLSENPVLIFALGAKAAYAAKLWTKNRQNIPVLFAMVLNWQRYDLLKDQQNIAGIDAETSPGSKFANMALFAPNVNSIGVIYSENNSKHILEEAQQASLEMGLELVSIPITKPNELKHAFNKQESRIQAFWILNDPIVYTLENITWLNNRCIQNRLVCLGPSQNIAELGLMMAIIPDHSSIGLQAASLADNIISKRQTPQEIGVMAPLGTKVILNMKTISRIGLDISPTALNFATEIIQ